MCSNDEVKLSHMKMKITCNRADPVIESPEYPYARDMPGSPSSSFMCFTLNSTLCPAPINCDLSMRGTNKGASVNRYRISSSGRCAVSGKMAQKNIALVKLQTCNSSATMHQVSHWIRQKILTMKRMYHFQPIPVFSFRATEVV